MLLSPRGNLRGLTRLDVRLLRLLVEGAPHISAIAAALGVDNRTVSDALGPRVGNARGARATG
ncbi:hypothetical protein SAMN05216574_1395 [Blastococcus tunisiensis]|uniref:Helix-turn-helix domain-containing protein n=1 Tax=Blastococcus tunisiensis TaxID=1798228 RepID=A0A1I2MYA4_9ACTN|nr:hypothetical protein SAMN05216574_1395 [Blastococcus sp. DSM 46838]